MTLQASSSGTRLSGVPVYILRSNSCIIHFPLLMAAEFSKPPVSSSGLGAEGSENIQQGLRVHIQLSSSRFRFRQPESFLLGLDAAGISRRRGTQSFKGGLEACCQVFVKSLRRVWGRQQPTLSLLDTFLSLLSSNEMEQGSPVLAPLWQPQNSTLIL